MRFWQITRQSLRYFMPSNLPIILGVMVGTMVLTGALLMGDSLKGSLRKLTSDRLGKIEAALAGDRFFPESLSSRLKEKLPTDTVLSPAIVLRGSVLLRGETGEVTKRISQVQIIGVEEGFWNFFGQKRADLGSGLLINQKLASELGVAAQANLELRLEKPQAIPAESLLGKKQDANALVLETSPVAEVLPMTGAGRFGLLPSHSDPLIVYVQLKRLQKRLSDQNLQPAGTVNALFSSSADVQSQLGGLLNLNDYGLSLRKDSTEKAFLSLETRRLLFEDKVTQLVQQAAKDAGLEAVPTMTYLINLTRHTNASSYPTREAMKKAGNYNPYSTIIGMQVESAAPFGPLVGMNNQPVKKLQDDEVVINEFIAKDLWPGGNYEADMGKPVVRVSYFLEGEGHQLVEKEAVLKLAAVVPITGLAAEKTLTPEFPGLKGTRIADWQPPFPKEQWHPDLVRKQDDDYFAKFKATPKLFISPATAQKLFPSRFGSYTAIRLGKSGIDLNEAEKRFTEAFLKSVKPAEFGLAFQPVKNIGLDAAVQGGTAKMFGGLFAGFSLFLIVAAALLVGLLFRLRTERRAPQIGLQLALGWVPKTARKLFMTEGMLLALVGVLLGIPLAIGYASLIIPLLKTAWQGSLASDALEFHLLPSDPAIPGLPYPTLIFGVVISLVIAWLAMRWSLKGLFQQSPVALMSGKSQLAGMKPKRGWVTKYSWLLLLAAVGISVWGYGQPATVRSGIFMLAGLLLLIVAIINLNLMLTLILSGKRNKYVWTFGVYHFGILQAARNRGRSLLIASLIAIGSFMVISVSSFLKKGDIATEKTSGSGGFQLIAETDVPLLYFPKDAMQWQSLLELEEKENSPKLLAMQRLASKVTVFSFRLRPGDDVSCLNLYNPTKPRLLGVPDSFIQRGGFTVATQPKAIDNHWALLKQKEPITLFADDHTAQWVLQKALGDKITLSDDKGTEFHGTLSGMIHESLFQSELLLSEEMFRQQYPSIAGYRYFLIETELDVKQIKADLELLLGESYGVKVDSVAEKLHSFHAVENTYITTFQGLGAMGLLLGTIGLGVVILRNVQERRSELALLQACGYSPGHIQKMFLGEVLFLTIWGLLSGVAAALLAISPMLFTASRSGILLWALLLCGVLLVVALVASWLALLSVRNMSLTSELSREA